MFVAGLAITLRKVRAGPWILYYKMRSKSPRDYGGLWNDYWQDAHSTESENDVLWDVADDDELDAAVDKMVPHLDSSLPVLDLGCGNGRRARFLASRFDRVVGVDVSPAAIDLAREQSTDVANVSYRVLDVTDPNAVQSFCAEIGPMNVYMRTVFHVIHPKDRPNFIASLAALVADRGLVYQLETDGRALDYFLGHPEDSPTGLPKLMHRVVEHGIIPHGFGADDCDRWYGGSGWSVIESGETVVHTQPVGGVPGRVPAYYVIARPPEPKSA
jgi:SAM-dependent methyltransferase